MIVTIFISMNYSDYKTKMLPPDKKNFISFEFYRGNNCIGVSLDAKDCIERAKVVMHKDLSGFIESARQERFEANGIYVIKKLNTAKFVEYCKEYQENIDTLVNKFKTDLILSQGIFKARNAEKVIDCLLKNTNNDFEKTAIMFTEIKQFMK